MKCVLIFCISAVLGSKGTATSYAECDCPCGKVKDVKVKGCEGLIRCPLKKGENSALSVHFLSTADTGTLKPSVDGIINGMAISYSIPQRDGCLGCGLQCPLENGKDYNYTAEIPVRQYYPKVELNVKWKLTDDQGDVVFCVIIPVQIVD